MHMVVDTTNMVTRGFYAYPENSTRDWGIYAFINMMLDTIGRHEPGRIHFCFDHPVSWRKAFYPPYKATRKAKPEFLQYQLDTTYDMLKASGLSVYRHSGAEADDLIATLCQRLDGWKLILSSDKDLFQLLSPTVLYWRYTRHFKEAEMVTPSSLKANYCIENGNGEVWRLQPEQWADYQAICGDNTDNIPGLPLYGPKKALKMIKTYQSVPNILLLMDTLDELKNIAPHREKLAVSYRLTKLAHVVGLDLKDGCYEKGQFHKLAALLKVE